VNDDERFLYSLREEPREEFAESLRRRLEKSSSESQVLPNADSESVSRRPRFRLRLMPAVVFAGLAAAVVSLVISPSVRASAKGFLDLFRVRKFSAVRFDPARLEQFESLKKDMSLLVFDSETPREPRVTDAPSRAAAEAVIGMSLLQPTSLPDGLTRASLQTVEYDKVRVAASTEKLRLVVDALDLRDVDVPDGLDGEWIEVQLFPAVSERWTSERRHLVMTQARSPEVTLPDGIDLALMGRIGLRILGLDPAEADRLARTIDWNSTLLIPVPSNATEFREIPVRGQNALLVTTKEVPGDAGADGSSSPDGEHRRSRGSVLLWAESDRVVALMGNLDREELVAVAESLQ